MSNFGARGENNLVQAEKELLIGTLALLPADLGQVLFLDQKYIFLLAPAGYGIPLLMLIGQFWRQRKSQLGRGYDLK